MSDYENRRKNRIKLLKKELKESSNDVWYIKAESGTLYHIAINDLTFCNYGSGLMSYWKRDISEEENFCYHCLLSTIHYLKYNPSNYRYPPKGYYVSWRCSAMVKKKGKGKKLKRCSNCSGGADKSFCSQHEKCFIKYIYKYISVSQDVSKMIYKLL